MMSKKWQQHYINVRSDYRYSLLAISDPEWHRFYYDHRSGPYQESMLSDVIIAVGNVLPAIDLIKLSIRRDHLLLLQVF